MIKEINITYGLPASGKTRWSKEQISNYYNNNVIYHLEMDGHLYGRDSEGMNIVLNSQKEFEKRVKESIIYKLGYIQHRSNSTKCSLIIDGLFMTNDSLIKMIKSIKSIKNHYKTSMFIRIINFVGDRETSVWNDKGRLDRFGEHKNAKVTIENGIKEELDIELLKSEHDNIEVSHVKAVKKPLLKNFIYDDGNDYTPDELESDTWSTGGTWRNCYDSGGDIESEEPVFMETLNNLLVKCNAVHLYDDIIDNIAIEHDDNESDYYGGCRYFSWYVINIKGLEEYLKEKGFLRNLLINNLVGDDK